MLGARIGGVEWGKEEIGLWEKEGVKIFRVELTEVKTLVRSLIARKQDSQ